MPRYFFNLVSPTNPVRDTRGVELAGLNAAHWHAMHLIYRIRTYAGEADDDWVVEVSWRGERRGVVLSKPLAEEEFLRLLDVLIRLLEEGCLGALRREAIDLTVRRRPN